VAKVIEKERPDAVLPTLGGQTALNAAIALDEAGITFARRAGGGVFQEAHRERGD